MLLAICILIAGFALLIKSADILVDGASSIAKKFGISGIVIGLTVVAFGTSAPELIVNIFSSAKGAAEIALGNIIGSNIANILLILGITALIHPVAVKKNTMSKELPLSLLAIIIVGVMANDLLIDHIEPSILSRSEGIALLSFFIIFIYYTFGIARVSGEEVQVKTRKTWLAAVMVAGGILGLTIGGKLVVDNAIIIAKILNVSEALIGLTIVAIGTSLPELATSAVAAYRKQSDIAIGNVVGSNIFNLFWILGLSSIIRPLPLAPALNFDILFAIIATIILLIFIYFTRPNRVTRWEGACLVSLYIGYIAFLIIRG